ncbi:hypothetical protein AB0J83_22200 [Actinoplanes sp. NPDC049596]|uniref:hypothetical protein n=1 Tax=unclassified Actinoplanes TaxID=2626549 RepID=UPI00344A67BA
MPWCAPLLARNTPANFGGRTATTAPSLAAVPAVIAQRLRDCDRAHTRLLGVGGHIDVTAPWAGDRHTLGVKAGEHEGADQPAQRITADPSFLREDDPVDSVTLLSATGIGADLHAALTRRGHPVRVYEASTELIAEPEFVITGAVTGSFTAASITCTSWPSPMSWSAHMN